MQVNSGNPPSAGRKVVVVGGGNTAVDREGCIAPLRLNAREATLLYRRSRAEMPASEEEVKGALDEGVKIEFLAAPLKIQNNIDKFVGGDGIICEKLFDSSDIVLWKRYQ